MRTNQHQDFSTHTPYAAREAIESIIEEYGLSFVLDAAAGWAFDKANHEEPLFWNTQANFIGKAREDIESYCHPA